MAHNLLENDSCTVCHNTYPIDLFVKDSKRKLGYRKTCKECHKKRSGYKKLSNKNSRVCNSCKVDLSWNNFSNKNSRVCNICKIKNREELIFKTKEVRRNKKEHLEIYEKQKSKILKSARKRKADSKEFIIVNFFDGSCEMCGLKYHKVDAPVAIFDFHHKDEEKKKFNPSRKIKGKLTDEIINEILECQLLCSNCHRKLHWQQKENKS